jgi:surface protein
MFRGATRFNNGGFGGIGNWDTRAVTDMNFVFIDATAFNSPLSWNTAAVTSMAAMFRRATSFNEHLNLDTRNVNNMNGMFADATSFQGFGNIWGWNTSQVTMMQGTFQGARAFNQHIGNWNTSRVTDMRFLFNDAIAFNQQIGNWNTSQVTNMSEMFYGATNFNQPINTNGLATGAWNTSAVTNMYRMFRNAQQFNQNIGNWNTSQVTNMSEMFYLAQSFNNGNVNEWRFNGFLTLNESNQFFIPNIPPFRSIPFDNRRLNTFRSYWIVITPRQTMNWNTSNVRNMNNMFDQTANFFNVDLRRWSIRNDCPTRMFRNFSPMPDQFTPFQVGVNREGAGYT